MAKRISLALLTGGPSPERSIALNSTRSVLDNLDKDIFCISVVYFDLHKKPYLIPSAQIYSNTVSDFEFKVASIGHALTEKALIDFLRTQDLAWPVMHGEFGEDGEIQEFLEKNRIPFVGSGSEAARRTINKFETQEELKKNNFYAFGTRLLKKGCAMPKLAEGRYVLKPNCCGSSIGVEFADNVTQIAKKIRSVFQFGNEAVIERHCPGREFTIIVLENKKSEPVPLIPTEVEFKSKRDTFFSFRKKYLATNHIHFHTPPRFNGKTIADIRKEAVRVYKLFGFQDYARFDGWVMPDGKIWFSDLNSITGMEQNSFIFRQAAFLGMSHRDLLNNIVRSAATRFKLKSPLKNSRKLNEKKKRIAVIFGGTTAERQISLLTGTNVWVKLKSSKKYIPFPFLLDSNKKLWLIPHFFCLHHTVEEIQYLIKRWNKKRISACRKTAEIIISELELNAEEASEPLFSPQETTLNKIAKNYDFVFLGLHGGIGEDGTLQKKLERLGAPYNGSGTVSSRIGMDKLKTGEAVNTAGVHGLSSLRKSRISITEDQKVDQLWKSLGREFGGKPMIFKPRGDGCSAGVVKINNPEELKTYLEYLKKNRKVLPGGLLSEHPLPIDLPQDQCKDVLVEEFIETDSVTIVGKNFRWLARSGWIEISVGVLGTKNGLKALTPSQTIAMGKVLSVEEKFQGGTGINFTPPPQSLVNENILAGTRRLVAAAAKALGTEGYARLDCFLNIRTGEVIIIEINTLPALTPSTIIYHQALAEKPPLSPLAFLEKIIELGFKKKVV